MINTCKCGGEMRPIYDTPVFFTWRCNKCGNHVSQRKRRPKSAVIYPFDALDVRIYAAALFGVDESVVTRSMCDQAKACMLTVRYGSRSMLPPAGAAQRASNLVLLQAAARQELQRIYREAAEVEGGDQ